MPPIDLDLSPLLINRTAIFNIGRDVLNILRAERDFDVRHRFFGQIEAEWPDRHRSQKLMGRLGQAHAAAAGGRLRDWTPPARARSGSGGRAFLLDPLYVLFAPLCVDDVVMCLDLSTITHPEWHDANVARLYDEAFRRILEATPQLIMISRNTADTFYANFGTYRNNVTVVPLYASALIEAAAAKKADAMFRPAAPYFLFVGSLEARKNVIGAINAFAESGLAEENYRLCIVGGKGRGAVEIEARVAEVPGVMLAGYLGDHELSAVYAGATGFLYPSYLEGFGVPLLEAMAFGIPCVATTAGASPEVGGPLVRYRDPDDYAGMAADLRAISRLTLAQRERIASGLRRRARTEYSSAQFATRLAAALRADPARP